MQNALEKAENSNGNSRSWLGMMNNFTGGMPGKPTQQAVQYDPYQTQPQAPVQEQPQTAQ